MAKKKKKSSKLKFRLESYLVLTIISFIAGLLVSNQDKLKEMLKKRA